jgi:hypothetical protein
MSEFPHYKTLHLCQAAKVSRILNFTGNRGLPYFMGSLLSEKKASQECSGAATAFVSWSQPVLYEAHCRKSSSRKEGRAEQILSRTSCI